MQEYFRLIIMVFFLNRIHCQFSMMQMVEQYTHVILCQRSKQISISGSISRRAKIKKNINVFTRRKLGTYGSIAKCINLTQCKTKLYLLLPFRYKIKNKYLIIPWPKYLALTVFTFLPVLESSAYCKYTNYYDRGRLRKNCLLYCLRI